MPPLPPLLLWPAPWSGEVDTTDDAVELTRLPVLLLRFKLELFVFNMSEISLVLLR